MHVMIKVMLILGLIGHLLCAMTDVLIIFAKDGNRFDFKLMSDNEKMSEVMEHMPLNNPMLSILLGVLAIFIMIWGYFGKCAKTVEDQRTIGAKYTFLLSIMRVTGYELLKLTL